MKRSIYTNFPKSSAEYVIADAKWRRSRGDRPSMPYKGIKNPQKALALAEIMINDKSFKDLVVTKISKDSMMRSDGWSFWIDDEWPIKPKVGDITRFYGKGCSVRGLDINGVSCFYQSEEQQRACHLKQLAKWEYEEKADFKKNKTSFDQRYQNLPKVFQQRISRFRANNPDFRWQYESYELFCCEQAMVIVKAVRKRLKNAASKKNLTASEFNKIRPDTRKLILNKLYNLPYQKQLEAISGLDDGHSGNSFGCSMVLAELYLYYPSYVVKLHGALSSLVGSQKYGDIPNAA
jgi:hypothetical protein